MRARSLFAAALPLTRPATRISPDPRFDLSLGMSDELLWLPPSADGAANDRPVSPPAPPPPLGGFGGLGLVGSSSVIKNLKNFAWIFTADTTPSTTAIGAPFTACPTLFGFMAPRKDPDARFPASPAAEEVLARGPIVEPSPAGPRPEAEASEAEREEAAADVDGADRSAARERGPSAGGRGTGGGLDDGPASSDWG